MRGQRYKGHPTGVFHTDDGKWMERATRGSDGHRYNDNI